MEKVTVKYFAAKGCKVKIKGKYYSGNEVLPFDLDEKEIKQLLAERFIRKVVLDESKTKEKDEGDGAGDDGASGGGNGGEKSLEEMTKKELKAKAKELGVDLGLIDSEDEIRRKIKEAQGS